MFTAAWTRVGPKHAAVDKDLTVSSVLALVQHFLKDRDDGCDWDRTADGLKGRTMRLRDKRRANLKPLQQVCKWPCEYGREERTEKEISGKVHSFPGVLLLLRFHLKQAPAQVSTFLRWRSFGWEE